MLLTKIIKDLDYIEIVGDLNKEISKIAYDSREIVDNGVFVAISGFTVDGHKFIDTAIQNGAKTIILEKDINIDNAEITTIKVKDSRSALAKISSNYYNNPTERINMIGLTGTNGKTSTSFLVKSIFEQANKPIGLIGTMGSIVGYKVMETKNTTPESLNLQNMFSEMENIATKNCIMEVSSHALSLSRVASCDFNIGVFTNLSPDHLELHHDMEEYFYAKAKLFEMTKDYNIINIDDEYGRRLISEIKNPNAKTVTYGIENKADIYATDICYSAESTKYTVITPKGNMEININLPGAIYVYNSLAAIACAYYNDIEFEDIQKGIELVKDIKGRFEIVYREKDFKVIVDFAHTEDSLEKTLKTIRPFAKGRIILVFGVYAPGGKEGESKRKGMGRVAAEYADFSVVTSDNPKNYNPDLIIEDIIKTIQEYSKNYKAVVDRKEAIEYAIRMSNEDDVILIAGKGHETSQIINGVEIPFNEAEIVAQTIESTKQKIS